MKKFEIKELGLEFRVSRRALRESDKLKQSKDYFRKKTKDKMYHKNRMNQMNQIKATIFSGNQ